MTIGLRALFAAVLLCACAPESKQMQPTRSAARETTRVVPFNTTQCQRMRAEGKFRVRLRSVEAEQALQTVADVTCFTFAVEKGIKATVTIQPSDDHPEWTANELFNAVRAELEKQSVMVKEEAPGRYQVSAR